MTVLSCSTVFAIGSAHKPGTAASGTCNEPALCRTAQWWFRERRILQSRPVRTAPVGSQPAGCEVHLLTWAGDWRLALWAAKSFYHFSGVDWPIVFHDGGALTASAARQLLHHFPNARLFGWDEASSLVEARLVQSGQADLLRARRTKALMRKLVDVFVLAQARTVVWFDPDAFFVSRPIELIRLAEAGPDRVWLTRDSHSMYSVSPELACEWFGTPLPERLNSGLGMAPVAAVDLDFLNRAFAPGRVPADQDHFPEQTGFALLAGRNGLGVLPPEYTVATGTPPLDLRALGLVSRHYVSPVRHLLYEEGIPYLVRETNLI